MTIRWVLSIGCWILGATMACAEQKVGGRTVTDVFGANATAKLAGAACAGDLHGMKTAIAEGARVNGRGLDECTPLLWAIGCDSIAGIQALIEAGADPNLPIGPTTAVVIAATRHDPKPLATLLRNGGDANAVNRRTDRTALMEALSLGVHGFGWENYYALLETANINAADSVGSTIAVEAAALNQFEKVAELLERGYSHDLEYLARMVQVGTIQSEPARSQKARVLRMLEERGVQLSRARPAKP